MYQWLLVESDWQCIGNGLTERGQGLEWDGPLRSGLLLFQGLILPCVLTPAM